MTTKLDNMYMEMAHSAAKISHAERKKVGAILVVPNGGRYEGINGTPSGFDNCCEDSEYRYDYNCGLVSPLVLQYVKKDPDTGNLYYNAKSNTISKVLKTKKEVLHAESNAIMKVARSTDSSVGGTLYTTLSPCIECSKLIIQAGIVRVVCSEKYADTTGVELLRSAGVKVEMV